jgi:hypothetical protein
LHIIIAAAKKKERTMNANIPVSTSVTAVMSLIFGIASWIGLPFLGAIVAIVCGHIARGEIRRAPPGVVQGDGYAVAGLILGYLHLAIFALIVFGFLAFFGGFAWLAAHGI